MSNLKAVPNKYVRSKRLITQLSSSMILLLFPIIKLPQPSHPGFTERKGRKLLSLLTSLLSMHWMQILSATVYFMWKTAVN